MKKALLVTDTRRAHISNEVRTGQFVVEIVALGAEFEVHETLQWVDVVDSVEVGDFFDGVNYVKELEHTPLALWEGDMRVLDQKIKKDVRFWEELAKGVVSLIAQARMDALILERETKRTQRPS